jgi:histidine triad (HIT) family protein
MSGCVFCSIAAGELDAPVVYESDHSIAFLDHRPVFHGHTLLIPRAHHETLPDLPDHLIEPYFTAARLLAGAVKDALEADGTFVAMNNAVSQSVPHLHVHIVPRRRKDGLRGFFWPRTKYTGPEHVEDFRARIAAAVATAGNR